jgi:subtilisin family serine protease
MKHTNIITTATAILCFIFLFNQNTFGQLSVKANAKDWLTFDPKMDSIAGISLYKAYELLKSKTSKAVVVAVIDNGVDIEHEDLKKIIWTNKKEIPDNGIDDDHNGYIDDVHGWNFRGSKDGTIIDKEQAGATQIYVAGKNKYERGDTDLLKSNERKEWLIYTKAKAEYFDKINNSKDSTELNYSYNPEYNSYTLIANDSNALNNRYYGSPYFKLTPNLNHGTYVSGIIAAERDNNIGTNGIADNVLIMPVVASTQVGDERDKDVANAIHYAVDNGARIINISFSKVYSANKKLVDEAIQYAEKKKVLIIHCAGNDGVNTDSFYNYHYPIALYENGKKANNFITVGWSRPLFDYRLAHPNSGYGKKNVDLFAPGSDIYTTAPHNEYDFRAGSSMSAPCVTGVAALLLSYFPSLSIIQVKDILLQSTFNPNQLVNKPGTKIQVSFSSLSVSGGILNAYKAVKLAIETTKKRPGRKLSEKITPDLP